jgi:hypothetical protein
MQKKNISIVKKQKERCIIALKLKKTGFFLIVKIMNTTILANQLKKVENFETLCV